MAAKWGKEQGFHSICLLQVLVLRQNSIIRARKFARSFLVECKPCFNAKALFAMRFQLIRSRSVRDRFNWLLSRKSAKACKNSKKQTSIFIFVSSKRLIWWNDSEFRFIRPFPRGFYYFTNYKTRFSVPQKSLDNSQQPIIMEKSKLMEIEKSKLAVKIELTNFLQPPAAIK